MSTTTSRSPAARTPRRADPAEQRVLLRGVSPELFEAIVAARGDDPTPRLAYRDGDLELMSPSQLHEILARRLANLVRFVARGLRLRHREVGSATWRRLGLPGKEPDASFYFARTPAVQRREPAELAAEPAPDLAIEVEISPPEVDIEPLYAGLGVPELWRCDGQRLRILHLGPDGRYAEHQRSRALPALRADEAMPWVERADEQDDLDWSDAVERWAREELANRTG